MSTTVNESMSQSMDTPRPMQFQGFQRSRGRVGVRNHVAVISTVALCNRIAQLAATRAGSPLVIAGDFQRGLQTEDAALQEAMLTQLLDHPNIGAALVLCHDRRTAQRWQQQAAALDKPIETLAVMDCQGVQNAIDTASAAIARLTLALAQARRIPCSFSQLTFALECGGSDASSAVSMGIARVAHSLTRRRPTVRVRRARQGVFRQRRVAGTQVARDDRCKWLSGSWIRQPWLFRDHGANLHANHSGSRRGWSREGWRDRQ